MASEGLEGASSGNGLSEETVSDFEPVRSREIVNSSPLILRFYIVNNKTRNRTKLSFEPL